MGRAHSTPQSQSVRPPPIRDNESVDVEALIAENAQLRELVIHLSKLVIKNVVDQK
jgi:hypothetical protein